ncbi:MAG: hypothetical protein GXP55_13415 [Deltaproteobacteria bacterium]|nr:hypothetical protein [Deltaproteobacteria bacterium]
MLQLGRLRCLFVISLLCAGAALACDDEPPPLVLPPVVPIVRPELLSPRPIATSSAFDLVALDDGAALVYSPPSRAGGGVRLAAMDAFGSHRGQDPEVFSSVRPEGLSGPFVPVDAAEVEAASGGGRLAIAWVARNNGVFSVVAALGEATGRTFGPPTTLGLTPLRTVGGRGQVAVAVSESGIAEVHWRAGDGSCEPLAQIAESAALQILGGSPELCIVVHGERLFPDEPAQDSSSWTLPRSCDHPIGGAAFLQDRWYYGICARAETGDSAATLVLGLNSALNTVHAGPILAGCELMDLVAVPDAVVAVGRCGSGRRLVRVREGGRALDRIGEVTPSVDCSGAHPVLKAGTFSYPLAGSVAHLEALLPDSLAPRGARALWTGEALLIATPIGREVSLHRYQCEHGELVRTNGP